MPEMDGFQVLGEIGANEMPVTIFVTAYDRYAAAVRRGSGGCDEESERLG